MKKEKQGETNITMTSVVLKETAEELNIPLEKVELVYEALTSFLRKVCSFSSFVSIFLPHLGTMYLRMGTLNKKIERLDKRAESRKLSSREKRKLRFLHKKKKILQKYLTNYPRAISRTYHIKRTKLATKSYTGFKSLEEIEKFQNTRNSK